MELLTNFLRLFFSAFSFCFFSSSISSCACLSASCKKKWQEIYFQFHFPCSERRESVPPQPVLLFWDVALNHYEQNWIGTNHKDLHGYSCLEKKCIKVISPHSHSTIQIQSECLTEEFSCDEIQERASVYVICK